MKLVALLTALPFAALADPPSSNELEASCAGVAPGRPNRLCTQMMIQDQNAKATECFRQGSSEQAFAVCYSDACEVQSQFCTGPGGQASCNSACRELATRRFANCQRMMHWQVNDQLVNRTVPHQNRADHNNADDSDVEEVSAMLAQIANPPGLKDLETACAGVAPGQPNRLCTKMQTQDQNAKAADCFRQDRSETAFNRCFAEVCDVQSQFCSGPGGRSKCNADCTKQTSRRFLTCSKMAKWEWFSNSNTEALLELSQDVFSPQKNDGPSAKDLLGACGGNAHYSHNCVVMRMRDVNAKATSCFAQFPEDEKSYLSCARNICSEQSHACSGSKGSIMCFGQCQEYASHQFTNFKAASKLPGAHWDPSAALTSGKVAAMKKAATKTPAPMANFAKKLSRHRVQPGVISHHHAMSLFARKSKAGPDLEDLEFACSGFAPGQHNRDCSMMRVRDTNARAAACYEGLPRNETTFHMSYQACCDTFCVNQSRTCTGMGGEEMCLSECKAFSYSQVATFQALGEFHGRQQSNKMALSQHHVQVFPAKALDAPSKEELHKSCKGSGSESDDKCLMARMRDSNAKTAACYMTTPDDEDSYKSCCTDFCEEQSEACTGARDKLSCKGQCVEYGESLFSKLKVLAEVMPEFSAMTTTTTPPPQASDQHKVDPVAKQATTEARKTTSQADRAALAQHRAALRGRHFSKVPTSQELQAACAHEGRGAQQPECNTLRKQHTHANARSCFDSSPGNKATYQSCCTSFCRAQSKSCGGTGGAGMCFQQCVEDAHPIFESLKVLAAVPGGLAELATEPSVTPTLAHSKKPTKARKLLAQQKSEVKPAVAHSKNSTSASFRGKHDPADVARVHSARADLK